MVVQVINQISVPIIELKNQQRENHLDFNQLIPGQSASIVL
jgi:hypothetical protein